MTDKITSAFGVPRSSIVGGLGYLFTSLPVEASAAATVDMSSITALIPADCLSNDSVPLPLWAGTGYLAGSSPGGFAEVSGVVTAGVTIEAWTGGYKLPVSATSASDGSWMISGLNPTLTYDVIGRYIGYDAEIYSGVTPSLNTLTLTGTIPTVHLLRGVFASLLIAGGSGVYSGATVTSGSLPTGLSLSMEGNYVVISGQPTAAGSNPVTISVNSSDSQTATLTQSITLDHWYTSLFASGELGMVFDFSDISSLYQDTAATTVCTAAGQTVKGIKCKETGLVLSNSTGNTLGQDSLTGRYFITFSGSAPYSISSGFPITGSPTAFSIAFNGAPTSVSLTYVLLAGPTTTNTAGAEILLGLRSFGDGTSGFSSSTTTGLQQNTGVYDGTNYNYYQFGSFLGSAGGGHPTFANSAVHLGSDAAGASGYIGVMWWAVVLNRVLTQTEISNLSNL